MAVTIKDYAAQIGLPAERLVMMLTDADIVGKTVESDLTARDKRALVMQMHKGRVRQVPKQNEPSLVQSQGRTGASREIVVEIKGGHTLAPRPIVAPVLGGEPDTQTDAEPAPEAVAPEQPADVDVPPTESRLADDSPLEEPPAGDPVPAVETQQPVETETPGAEVVDQAAQADAQPQPADQVSTDAGAAEPAKQQPAAPKRGKPKRKAIKRPREQLHVVKGREKLRRERERKDRVQNLDTRIAQHTFQTPSQKIVHTVSVADSNSIRELAQAMSVKVIDVMKYLIEELDLAININGSIDRDAATLVISALGHNPVDLEQQNIETELLGRENDDRTYLPRPPVVAVMGHVDHGKTTLLDSIRSTKVAASEKGGITQHIGAYMVETPRGKITFLDTPGHEAFTAMRVRGARATDLVILVVAADDGVMPQTVEAINHAKSAQVPIIVAINKIDKVKADPSRILRELTEHEVIAEPLGGDVQVVEISALKKTGIDDLLERIQLQAELMEEPLTAPIDGIASGVVIEARVDKGRGPVVTVLVQKGVLTPKQLVVAGQRKGKVRQLIDYRGKAVKEAKPSTPIEFTGFSKVPEVGDAFVCPPDEKSAAQLVEHWQSGPADTGSSGPEFLFGDSDDPKTINVVIKADVSGSAEALSAAVKNLSDERVEIKVVHSMVGGISQSDVNLAIAANAIIVAFNVRAESTARQLISSNDISVIYSGVIYEALEALKEVILSKVGPDMIDHVIATVNVLEVFRFSKVGTIAGCFVEDGTVRNKLPVRIVRDNVIIHDGMIDSLRRFKHDVPEVKAGLECGIQVRNYHDISIHDMLEVYESREAGR